MKYLVVLAATVALAGCGGSVQEQAASQCADQVESMSAQLATAGISGEELCDCILADISEGSSIEEANEAITGRTQQCAMQAAQGQLG